MTQRFPFQRQCQFFQLFQFFGKEKHMPALGSPYLVFSKRRRFRSGKPFADGFIVERTEMEQTWQWYSSLTLFALKTIRIEARMRNRCPKCSGVGETLARVPTWCSGCSGCFFSAPNVLPIFYRKRKTALPWLPEVPFSAVIRQPPFPVSSLPAPDIGGLEEIRQASGLTLLRADEARFARVSNPIVRASHKCGSRNMPFVLLNKLQPESRLSRWH